MSTSDPGDQLVNTTQLASLLSVCVRTIRNWELKGILPPPLRIGGGHRRWRLAEVRAKLASATVTEGNADAAPQE